VTPANWNGYQPAPPNHPGLGRQIAWASVPVGPAGIAERTRLRDLMLFA
jgi:hypothetical protein